jgi:hypothetical protein
MTPTRREQATALAEQLYDDLGVIRVLRREAKWQAKVEVKVERKDQTFFISTLA